jgi:lysophospholipase L1-like esterase
MASNRKRALRSVALVFAGLVALAAAGGAPAGAQDPPVVVYGDAKQTGTIHLLIYALPGSQVTVYEDVGGRLRPLRKVDIDPVGEALDIAGWRCDRRQRRFVASLPLADGSVATAVYETRTPSCRGRMLLRLPGAVRPGDTVPVRISDRWRTGGVSPRLCVAPPAGRLRCGAVRLRGGRALAIKRLRFDRRGSWRVQLRLAGHRLSRRVQVGGGSSFVLRGAPSRIRALLTGDSMMLNIDSVIADRLRGRMETIAETRVGSGISKPGFDWIANARRQMRRLQPDTTVVYLGANDAFDMQTPAGERVSCCGEPWIGEYARRVATMMQIYGRDGAASSVWLTIPAPRLEEYYLPIAAVNEGIRRAASVSLGVRVLKLDELFTPGFQFRKRMLVRGRRQVVRSDDGLHLSLLGARMAASRVAGELRALGLL